jgi:hypothetical protein
LPGIGQRLALIGGTFQAGPLAEGGWRLSASIPLPPSPDEDHDSLGSEPPLSAGLGR